MIPLRLRLAQDGDSEPGRTGEGRACHNVTDDRAELISLVLSTALAKWRSSPDPEELRGILLRLLVALESASEAGSPRGKPPIASWRSTTASGAARRRPRGMSVECPRP